MKDNNSHQLFQLLVTQQTPQISCIEVPGSIEGSGQAAVRALGGEATLKKVLGKPRDCFEPSVQGSMLRASTVVPSQIFLRMCPEDRFSKFLVSAVTPRSDLLVRVRRKKKTRSIISITLVGRIVEKATFEALSDFYCIPPPNIASRQIFINVEREMDETVIEPLYIPPPTFTRLIAPCQQKLYDTTLKVSVYQKKKILELKKTDRPTIEDDKQDIMEDEEKVVHEHDRISDENNNITAMIQSLEDQCLDELFPKNTILDQAEQNESNYHRTSDATIELLKETENVPEGSNDYGTICNAICKFDAVAVPMKPPVLALAIDVDMAVVEAYKRLFDQRPLWLRPHLGLQLNIKVSDWKRKPALARVCYYIADGPWRGSLCRLGYNPKFDKESRGFQTIDFRDPFFRGIDIKSSDHPLRHSTSVALSKFTPIRFSGISNNTDSHQQFVPRICNQEASNERRFSDTLQQSTSSTLEDEIRFRAPPTRPSVFYHLCDIDDSAVQKVLDHAELLDSCSRKSGWYPKAILDQVRDLMMMTCKNMREIRGKIKA